MRHSRPVGCKSPDLIGLDCGNCKLTQCVYPWTPESGEPYPSQPVRPAPVSLANCATLRMTTGGEKSHPIVIHDGMVKEWVGFGWIDLGLAVPDDYLKYPEVEQ